MTPPQLIGIALGLVSVGTVIGVVGLALRYAAPASDARTEPAVAAAATLTRTTVFPTVVELHEVALVDGTRCVALLASGGNVALWCNLNQEKP